VGLPGRMLPPDWTAYRRPDDDELLGYLAESPDGTVPLALFGVALGPPGTRAEAETVLRDRGLATLADPWALSVGDGEEVRVAVLTAYPDRVLVVPAPYGYADPAAQPVVVAAEDGARRLRPWR
jgi:hypothetical protein